MINLIKADFYKINRSMIYKVLFLISSICAAVTTVISHLINNGDIDMSSGASAAMLTDVVMLSLINSVLAGQMVCGDFDNKLIQSSLTGCSGRFTVVCAKMFTYSVMVVIMTLPYAICTIVGVCMGSGFSAPFSASSYLKILFESNTVEFSAESLLKYIVITVIMMLVYAAQSGIMFAIGFFMKNKALLTTAISFIISTLIGMSTSMITSEAGNDFLSLTPYSGDIYSLGNETEAMTLVKIALVCIAFLAAYTGIAYAAFRRSEIK